jgi:hypothetical protein
VHDPIYLDILRFIEACAPRVSTPAQDYSAKSQAKVLISAHDSDLADPFDTAPVLVSQDEQARLRAGAGEMSESYQPHRRFAIALSFPEEHRHYVQRVAEALLVGLGGEQARSRIFYDKWHEAEIIGYGANRKMQYVYAKESELIVPFYCTDYLKKNWCGVELRAIESILHDQEFDRVLPFRFDMVEIPGSFKTDIFPVVTERGWSPEKVASLILARSNKLAACGISREPARRDEPGNPTAAGKEAARQDKPQGPRSGAPASAGTSETPAHEAQKRSASNPLDEINAIKKRMVDLLRKSPAATNELRKVLNLEEIDSTGFDARAREAIDTLTNRPHRDATLALVHFYESLDGEAKRVIGELAEDYACLLVDEEDLVSLRQKEAEPTIGAFVLLPTTNETLVEIIMARHAGQTPAFAIGDWPRGVSAIPRPPIRSDPYSDGEILDAFQKVMEDKCLSQLEAKKFRDKAQRRAKCNERHGIQIAANRRRRYFFLDDLEDHQQVESLLRREWPSVAFVVTSADMKESRANLLFLLKDLFRRRPGGQE